ncbi:DUF4920 domain-containing protein [Aquimarina sp. 2201CG5-10]|uniref:DUF4920 domain-containing protein n=1 Tax=Aquimarina callyspongiae TaxID=3098150 RepID=UPI002AB58AA5|nr:DUF4920 domain-containing protein [Aquimarina sp. 2201CG5-10]MDY8134132.1 DUF4920 domain-containing protein [Aquimarina sp. 2201CG5-10]
MKKTILFLAGLTCIWACNSVQKDKSAFSVDDIKAETYNNFGEKVLSDQIYYKDAISEKYDQLKEGDTVDIAFSSTVNGVCKAKGCWMKVGLGDEKQAMVKFKNYGFFVPKDIENDTVIVQGKAFVSEMSVDEQRHFAMDAGKSEEEIAAITTPKKTYSFIADGVLIKN